MAQIMKRRVLRSMVKIDGHFYGSSQLYDGSDVFVALDPDHAGRALILSADRTAIVCSAICPELSGLATPTPVDHVKLPDAWLVIRAQARQAFADEAEAIAYAGQWGKIIPLAKQPPATGMGGVVQVCPECDIADCKHLRLARRTPPATELDRARVSGFAEGIERAAKIADEHAADFERQADGKDDPHAHDALLLTADACELTADAIRAIMGGASDE